MLFLATLINLAIRYRGGKDTDGSNTIQAFTNPTYDTGSASDGGGFGSDGVAAAQATYSNGGEDTYDGVDNAAFEETYEDVPVASSASSEYLTVTEPGPAADANAGAGIYGPSADETYEDVVGATETYDDGNGDAANESDLADFNC